MSGLPWPQLFSVWGFFLLNVLTGDWNAWAYGWRLPVAGVGAGMAISARLLGLRREVYIGGASTAIGGVTLFALFGAIAGGPVIGIMVPILLVLVGLGLRWLRIDLPKELARGADPAQSLSEQPAAM